MHPTKCRLSVLVATRGVWGIGSPPATHSNRHLSQPWTFFFGSMRPPPHSLHPISSTNSAGRPFFFEHERTKHVMHPAQQGRGRAGAKPNSKPLEIPVASSVRYPKNGCVSFRPSSSSAQAAGLICLPHGILAGRRRKAPEAQAVLVQSLMQARRLERTADAANLVAHSTPPPPFPPSSPPVRGPRLRGLHPDPDGRLSQVLHVLQ